MAWMNAGTPDGTADVVREGLKDGAIESEWTDCFVVDT